MNTLRIDQIVALCVTAWFVVALLLNLFRGAFSGVWKCARYRTLRSLVVLFAACHITAYVSAVKPQTNDTDGVNAPTYGLMSAYVHPEIGGLTDDGDVYSVSNVFFGSFGKTGDVVSAGITIGENSIGWGDVVRIYATDNLEHPVWTNAYEHEYEGETSLAVQFDMSQFPTSFLQRALFGLDYPQDSDGDGIADGDERYRYHSNPAKYDTDDDGLGDGDELRIGSSLISADSDGDGLSDSEETGGALVLTGSSMLWLDTSSCTEFALSYAGWSDDWNVSIQGGVTLAGSTYTSCNVNMSGQLSFGDGEVTVDACGRSLYSDRSWESKVFCGTVITNGIEYFVVECRNLSTDSSGVAKLSCQIAIPKSMRDVIYVSYQRVDDGIRHPQHPLGVVCSRMSSPFDGLSEYAILPPVGYRIPVANTTIKYIIGLGSDPTVYNRYEEPILPPTSNSNAYYTVDIVADDHAHIVFSGDGPSDLPDPDFWALPGDTNRVKLLIGKSYEIQGSSIFTVTSPSDPDAVMSNVSSTRKTVVSPVQIECVPPVRGRLMATVGGGFSMNVYPSYLGGLFYWTNSCCQITGNGNVFNWWCSGCSCNGCTAKGYYRYEGYDIECAGIPCGCTPDDDDNEGVSFELNMPNTMFVNNDDDDNDGVVDYGRNFGVVCEDDVAPVVMKLRNPTDESGTVTIIMSGNFHGTIVEENSSYTPINQSKTWNVAAGELVERAILLDPSGCSSTYNDCQLTVSWSLSSGEHGTETRDFTVVEPVAEPICNETKNVIIDGAIHHLTYNPCGVAVGKDAYFKVDVEPESFPDSLIKWSVDATSVGDVSFPRGNTGREVKVRGASEGSVLLNVKVGDSVSDVLKFNFYVVTNIAVDIDAVVIGNGRRYAWTMERIDAMIKEANDIYLQLGYTFKLSTLTFTNMPHAYNVAYNNATETSITAKDLVDFIVSTNRLECYFVNRIIDSSEKDVANGVSMDGGIVVAANCRGNRILAHEIGHRFNLEDIYIRAMEQTVAHLKICRQNSPRDWNGGCDGFGDGGVRYYDANTKYEEVIKRLLMYGVDEEMVASRDLTIGIAVGVCWIYGATYDMDIVGIDTFVGEDRKIFLYSK